jgi:DNA-binding MarR family transcriptional regulator
MGAGANPAAPVAEGTPRTRARRARAAGPRDARARELTALTDAFRRTFRALNRLRGRDTHLAGAELSHAQFQLLAELEERGETAVGELAAAAQLAAGTVTGMLDGLAAAGHVQRVRCPDDRRIVLARLTPAGRAAIASKRAAWQARWEDALAGLGSDELAAATRVLEHLAAMFDEASAGPAATDCATPAATVSADPATSAKTRRKPV